MRSLTPKQARLVSFYVANGGNATHAAIAAGYGVKGAHVTACRMLKRPNVLKAVAEETIKRLSAGVALGASVLEELARSAESESVRLAAAQALLDRGGLAIAQRVEHLHLHADERTDAQLLAHAKALALEIGLRPVIEAKATILEGEGCASGLQRIANGHETIAAQPLNEDREPVMVSGPAQNGGSQ